MFFYNDFYEVPCKYTEDFLFLCFCYLMPFFHFLFFLDKLDILAAISQSKSPSCKFLVIPRNYIFSLCYNLKMTLSPFSVSVCLSLLPVLKISFPTIYQVLRIYPLNFIFLLCKGGMIILVSKYLCED